MSETADRVKKIVVEHLGVEQQAEIVRHRFLADRGVATHVVPPPELLPFA